MSALAATGMWTQQQRAWLQALGHTVYLPRADELEAATPSPKTAWPEAAAMPVDDGGQVRNPPKAPTFEAPPPLRRAAPVPPPPPLPDTAPPAAGFARRPPVRMPDRLQIALLRASGLNPNEAETQRLMAAWPLAGLRGDPAAKRALWPQLRALRRGR